MPLSQQYLPSLTVWIEIYPSSTSSPHKASASIALPGNVANEIAESIEQLPGVRRVNKQELNGVWLTEYELAVNWQPDEVATALAYEFQQQGIPTENIKVEVK